MNLGDVLNSFNLKKADAEQIEGIFTKKISLSNGDYFVEDSQIVGGIGFIKKGACRFFYNRKGDEFTRWVSFEGEFITSLASFLYQKPAYENIQAIRDTEILFAERKAWYDLFEKNEVMRGLWLKTLEELYVDLEHRVFRFLTLNAEERYRWMFENQPNFINQVPDKYLAQMLGITPRHLTRLRSKRI